jgi:superfamily II DNA/RNA helicase
VAIATKDRIKSIYQALPQRNCGRFARAVAEGKASPFGCRQDPRAGYRISEILGQKLPYPTHGLTRPLLSRRPHPLPPTLLREELSALSARADDILTRIEKLKRQGSG